ncbi:hypothetical protein HY792_04545 [Candidatus Desantisbacteria bacterium]|nr:hypothetical protein [Candidatus Desantisbacteria bacterium]
MRIAAYDPNWREVFLLLYGYINLYGKKSEISLIIGEFNSRKDNIEPILHKNLLLTGEIVADLGLKDRLAEDIIDEVIDLAVSSPYFTLREEATKVLKKAICASGNYHMSLSYMECGSLLAAALHKTEQCFPLCFL